MANRYDLKPTTVLIDVRTGQPTRDLFLLLQYLNTVGNSLSSLVVASTIVNGDTTHAPSGDAVFDALALKVPTTTTISAGGIATGGGDLSANRTITVTAAAQSDQETGSSTSVAVVPGVQQFHPSAAKCWAFASVSGGTPTLDANYNITSITDSGVGDLTITIATDFSSATWACLASARRPTTNVGITNSNAILAGSCELKCYDTTATAVDPSSWSMGGFGDQ